MMVRDSLRTVPDGEVDVTLPVTIDGLSYIDPNDRAMPMYRVIANNRHPVALRDLMIAPVRSGYIGDGLVLSANYRSAPEFAFPVPLDDAFDVYRWVVDHGDETDADPSPLAVAGDSAGSNLAAAISLRARDDGVRGPDAVVMLGGFAVFQFERWPSFLELAPRGIVYDMPFAGFIRGAYVGTTPWNHPWVSPVEADLTGYPLAVVVAGTHDPIVDSAKALAAPFGR